MTDEALIRAVWPEYSVVGPLGHGTFGTVWHVRRTDLEDMDAAVKVIGVPSDEGDVQALRADGFSEGQIDAFFDRLAEDWKNEIHLMKRYQGLSHFVSIEDCRVLERKGDLHGKWILIRMEKLKSLPAYLSDKTLTQEEVVDLGLQMCEALKTCHRDGLIHRDIKPENIFVQDRDASGVLYKLGDFGATRQTDSLSRSYSMKGAQAYMAPEILKTRRYDERADIYSLGLTLYRLMNGNRLPFLPPRQLFTHEDYAMAVHMRLNGAPVPPAADATPEFNRVLVRACATDPKDRYPSAEAFQRALEALKTPATDGKRILRRVGLPFCGLLLCASLLLGLRPWAARGTKMPSAGTAAQGGETTPVPMLAASIRPDPLLKALETVGRRWEEICAGSAERPEGLADCHALADCLAAAPALTAEEGGVLRLEYNAAGTLLTCVDQEGKEYRYTWDEEAQGFVFRNLTEKEPDLIRAYRAEYPLQCGGRDWQAAYTYAAEAPFRPTGISLGLLRGGAGERTFTWEAERDGENLSCLLVLDNGEAPPTYKRYTLTDRRNDE